MLTHRKQTKSSRNCMDCTNYRPLNFADDGTYAWCGRCTIPSPSGKRLRAVRDAMSPACDKFDKKGGDEGKDDAGEGKA